MANHLRHSRLLTLCFLVLAGCGKESSGVLRRGSPEEAAARVFELYDGNKDGTIVQSELAASPALVGGLPRIDSNRDKAIDVAEMTARFARHDSMSDLIAFQLEITSNRTPLDGATVDFIPEPFMGADLQSYTGTSAGGSCTLRGKERPVPGVPTGYYTVHIMRADSNIDVKLGCEVADDTPSPNRLTFDVKLTSTPAAGGR